MKLGIVMWKNCVKLRPRKLWRPTVNFLISFEKLHSLESLSSKKALTRLWLVEQMLSVSSKPANYGTDRNDKILTFVRMWNFERGWRTKPTISLSYQVDYMSWRTWNLHSMQERMWAWQSCRHAKYSSNMETLELNLRLYTAGAWLGIAIHGCHYVIQGRILWVPMVLLCTKNQKFCGFQMIDFKTMAPVAPVVTRPLT